MRKGAAVEGLSETKESCDFLEGSLSEQQSARWSFCRQFEEEQFIFDRARFKSLQEAVLSGPGLLDCYSGAGGFAKALVRQKLPWALCFELKKSSSQDLSKQRLQQLLRSGLRNDFFAAMCASPVCASFSTAITPPWRSRAFPAGRPDLTAEQNAKIWVGQQQLQFVLSLVEICVDRGIIFWVENPDQSWFWKQQGQLSWDDGLAKGSFSDFRTDHCRWGAPWRKRTRFRTNCHLAGKKLLCVCKSGHVVLRGRSKLHGMNYTKLAESYPRRLCAFLAAGFAVDLGLKGKCRKLDLGACAKCNSGRIGEASNPGPRMRAPERFGSLSSVQLLEPQTVQMRARLWKDFSSWVDDTLGEGTVEQLSLSPCVFVKVLEVYGEHCFSIGMSLHYYRQLIAHVQKVFPETKLFISGAWQTVSKW